MGSCVSHSTGGKSKKSWSSDSTSVSESLVESASYTPSSSDDSDDSGMDTGNRGMDTSIPISNCSFLEYWTSSLPYRPIEFTIDDIDNVLPAEGWHQLSNRWYQDDIGRILMILDDIFYYQLYLHDDVVICVSKDSQMRTR
jgi:hypothetical protein